MGRENPPGQASWRHHHLQAQCESLHPPGEHAPRQHRGVCYSVVYPEALGTSHGTGLLVDHLFGKALRNLNGAHTYPALFLVPATAAIIFAGQPGNRSRIP